MVPGSVRVPALEGSDQFSDGIGRGLMAPRLPQINANGVPNDRGRRAPLQDRGLPELVVQGLIKVNLGPAHAC